jgi:hypothetical protein
MKRNRISIIVIVLLILSNAFTIFLLVKGKHRDNHPPFISEKIGLTGERLEKVKKMEEIHFDKMKPLILSINQKQAELFSDLANTTSDKHDSIQKQLNVLEQNRQTLLLEHFKTIYSICDADEKKRLLNEINQHFSRHKHPK